MRVEDVLLDGAIEPGIHQFVRHLPPRGSHYVYLMFQAALTQPDNRLWMVVRMYLYDAWNVEYGRSQTFSKGVYTSQRRFPSSGMQLGWWGEGRSLLRRTVSIRPEFMTHFPTTGTLTLTYCTHRTPPTLTDYLAEVP